MLMGGIARNAPPPAAVVDDDSTSDDVEAQLAHFSKPNIKKHHNPQVSVMAMLKNINIQRIPATKDK